MKKIQIIAALMGLLGLWSCNKYDFDFQDTALAKAPVLKTPATASVVTIQTADLVKPMSISWDAADYGTSGNIIYKVQLAKAGTNFAAPYNFAVTGFNKTSIAGFTTRDFNNAILSLGCTRGQEANLEMRVCSTTNGVTGQSCSTVNTLKVTTYAVYPVLVKPTANTAYNIDSTSVKAVWTGADYGNGEKFSYAIQIAKKGTSFNPILWTATTNNLNYPISVEDLNDLLLDAGYKHDEIAELEIRVVASATGVESATTNVIPFTMRVNAPSIGIIGSATPGGWDTDTDMADPDGDGIYFVIITLTTGEVKFRANNAWTENWGGATGTAADFPSGTGVFNSSKNIPVPAGVYRVTFNTNTLEYRFESVPPVGIIGSATPGGWSTDTDMKNNLDGTYELLIGLTDGEVKFRANDGWDLNWGGPSFPNGTGTQGGANIVATAGLYKVRLNIITGEYSFTPYSIGLIGSATPDGWNSDVNMVFNAANPNVLTLNITLTGGEVKFRANDAWVDDWGGTSFPSGTAVYKGGNIAATAGTYNVSFNVLTLAYSFQ